MRVTRRSLIFETGGVFLAALAALMLLGPNAPFTRELGVCESGAVRDVLAGNIILPHFVPGPIVHVPPLYWWTAALCVRLFGWTELALRLPSIVAAALTCAALYAAGVRWFNRRAACWAALTLLFGHFFLDAARQPRMDAMLALFVTLATIFLGRALIRPTIVTAPARPTESNAEASGVSGTTTEAPTPRLWLTLAALAMAAGIFAKSVPGILLPGLAAGLYLVVRRRWRELFRYDLIVTFSAALALGLTWYVAGFLRAGWPFLQWQLGMNLWRRFIPAAAGGADYCVHPFWYFGPQIIVGFLPWSLYLPVLAIASWPRRERSLPPPLVFTWCWFLAIFVFFSASRGKCSIYILPALPPLALLTGYALDLMLSARGQTRRGQPPLDRALAMTGAAASAIVGFGALALAGLVIAFSVTGMPAGFAAHLHATDRRFLAIFAALATAKAPALILWLMATVGGGALALWDLSRARARLQLAGVAVVAGAGAFFWFATMNPALMRAETLRGFTHEIVAAVPPGVAIGHIGMGDCDLNFYAPTPLVPVYGFRCIDNPAIPRYIVVRERDFDRMPAADRGCLHLLLRSPAVDGQGPRLLLERDHL